MKEQIILRQPNSSFFPRPNNPHVLFEKKFYAQIRNFFANVFYSSSKHIHTVNPMRFCRHIRWFFVIDCTNTRIISFLQRKTNYVLGNSDSNPTKASNSYHHISVQKQKLLNTKHTFSTLTVFSWSRICNILEIPNTRHNIPHLCSSQHDTKSFFDSKNAD